MEEDDFFGVNYISKQPIPKHILPKSALSQARVNEKELAEVGFIDATFFPQLLNEDKGTELNKSNNLQSTRQRSTNELADDFFTQSIKNNKDTGFFSNTELSVEKVEEILSNTKDVVSKDGIKAIWQLIDSVWKCTHEELVDMMANRVIYETEHIIAFDKPYQMAYAGASNLQAQMDRLLVDLKRRLAPNIDRFYVISSLEKFCSGVVLFAKSHEYQLKIKKLLDEEHGLFRFRALVKNVPVEQRTRVNIPLIKVNDGQDHKLCPLKGKAGAQEKLYHLTTDVQLVNENNRAHIALVDAFSTHGLANVVRSHLYYGLNCSLIGDRKYIKRENDKASTFAQLPRLSDTAINALRLRKIGDIRKLPFFYHLAEVHLPENDAGRFSIVRAEMPKYFSYVLKRLNLFKK